MITMAAGNASQNHAATKPENSSTGIFHREQTQKRLRPMSVTDEPIERFETCKKEQLKMQSFRDKVPANASPKSNSHFNVKNDKDGHVGGSQLPTIALLQNQPINSKQTHRERGKLQVADEDGSPSGISSKHFAYYDEITQPDVTEDYEDDNSIGNEFPENSYYPREFEKRRCSECGTEKDGEYERSSRSSCGSATCCQCHRVEINISGQIFQTQLRTLEKFPHTLLGNPEKRRKYYDPSRDQYFFDRDRLSFDGILNYYQNDGRLRRPLSVAIDVFAEEIKFFQLGIEAMATYQDLEGYEFSDSDMGINDDEKAKKSEKKEKLPNNKLQRKIWLLFEKPESSNAARVVAIISISVIFLSIICFCIETLPEFQEKYKISNMSNADNTTNANEIRWPAFVSNPFWIIETFCIIWFTIELTSRFLSCPQKSRFWLDILNVIDLVAIIPYFFSTGSAAIDHARGKHSSGNKGVSLAFFRVVRLVRVFRIFKLSRHSVGLQILGKTLKSSGSELGLLLFFVLIGVITFSSAIYFAEIDSKDTKFKSIPHAFWWAIVTMTTVGYGDIYPKTLAGKVIGSVCALCGILCLALPVPVIVSNFMYFYRRAKLKQRAENGL